MPEVKIPYPDVGQAAFEELDTYTNTFLLSGSDPKLEPGYPFPVKEDETLEQFHVVGLDANDKLVPATWDADSSNAIQAIGVVTQSVVGASDGSTTVPVFYTGCFNPDALVWDSTFDTDEKKEKAFFGAPSPTRIIIRKRG